MDFGKIIDDALNYTKGGILWRMDRWAKLIIATILLEIPMTGYIMRIYHGAAPAPEVDDWCSQSIDGLKLIVVAIVYSIPIIILWVLIYGRLVMSVFSGGLKDLDPASMAGFEPNLGLILLMYLFEIIIFVMLPVASIRFARTASFSEAFNVGAITGYIGRIGWVSYILALIIVAAIVGIPVFILMFAIGLAGILVFNSIIGTIIAAGVVMLIIAPPLAVFQARYLTRVYDSVVSAG
jgi:hypothetical protein